jgi:hypothetical protein
MSYTQRKWGFFTLRQKVKCIATVSLPKVFANRSRVKSKNSHEQAIVTLAHHNQR